MFQSKSKADKAADAATTQAKRGREAAAKAGGRAASTVQHQASGLVHSVKEKAGPLAASAAGFASHARERAVTSIDHGIDAAVPKVDAAVAGMEPRVDHARDVIVEDVLPRIHDMLVSIQASKDDLLSRQDGAIAAVTGAPKKRKRKGGMLLAFALLSAAGAGVAWYLNKQQSQPKTDPWATPSRPIGGAPGVDSQVRDSMGAGSSSMGTGTSSSLGAAGAGAGATSAGAVAAEAHDSDNGTGGAAASSSGDQDEARMLGTEEIDDLADDAQTEEVEIPGPNTEDTTGLGTTADPASERDTDLGDLGGQPRP